jgi:uncharacterized membrane protein YhiD involved in acid resistance
VLEDFQNITALNTDPIEILKNLSIALICGIIIALVYRVTYKGPSYSTQFVNSLILLALITAVVIMVIGNNLATAFGLVGAMSIIRFRTAVRDVQDIVFIFFALGIGLAAGVGLGALAIIGTIFISVVIFLVIATDINAPKKRNYMLQVNHGEDCQNSMNSTLQKFCRDFKLMSYQTNEVNAYVQAYYHIRLKKNIDHSALVSALKGLDCTRSVNLFFDDIEPRL